VQTVWCIYAPLSETDVLKFDESRACDAIIRHLEARAKAARKNVVLRDTHRDPTIRVELTFDLGLRTYALEHTGIEPFPDFVRLNNEAPRLLEPIKSALAGALPADDVFELHMPVFALRGHNKKGLRLIQDALVTHIIANAPTLKTRSYADYIGDITAVMPPGVPFSVRLYRFDSMGFGGRFQVVNTVTGDREARRRARIRTACDKKFPKLAAWKTAEGARTILILEDNDIQLTNQALVADAFIPIARQRYDAPDETYMLMTCNEDAWYAWPLLIDNVSYFDLSARYHPIHLEIDPATLNPITAR
jgi:hypothetical protein